MSILELHPDKIRVEACGCWTWTGAVINTGYGCVRVGGRAGKTLLAHRIAFLLAEGYLPPRPSYHGPGHGKALVLDHRCKNSSCVNPDHLEVVTNGENIRRGEYLHRQARLPPLPRVQPREEAALSRERTRRTNGEDRIREMA